MMLFSTINLQVPENPTMAVEEVMTDPGRLKDLDLDAFAEELARQGYGNTRVSNQLFMILCNLHEKKFKNFK